MDKTTITPQCSICGTTDHLLRCAKCKSSFYCSTAHQHMDWPNHKQDCRNLARQKNNKMLQLQQAIAATTLDSDGGVAGNLSCAGSTPNCSTANCSTVQMITPNMSALQQQQSSNSWTDVIDNRLAHLPSQFGCENKTLSTSPYTTNVSNSNYTNGVTTDSLFSNISDGQQTNAPQMNQLQAAQHQQFQRPLAQISPTVLYNNQNGQNEKSSSYQIGLADENFMGNANELRYEGLCRNIINDMNQYGLSVVDDFLGMEKGLQILNEVHRMYNAGVFKDGQLVNNIKNDKDLRTIRGDKITWVKGLERGCSNVGYLINQIDAVIYRANTMKDNGILGSYNIRERTKAMVACYPGSGAHYVTHVDNPNKDGRVITAIYYLNIDWNVNESGGILRIFPTSSNTIADIAPKFDRLIFFWSDKRNPHEVQPSHRTRYAITVWYFDANEREAALNRCKNQNDVNINQLNQSRAKTNTAAVLSQPQSTNSNFNNGTSAKASSTKGESAAFTNSHQEEADSSTSIALHVNALKDSSRSSTPKSCVTKPNTSEICT